MKLTPDAAQHCNLLIAAAKRKELHPTIVIGADKTNGSIAQAVEAMWPADAPLSSLVGTRYHHISPNP